MNLQTKKSPNPNLNLNPNPNPNPNLNLDLKLVSVQYLKPICFILNSSILKTIRTFADSSHAVTDEHLDMVKSLFKKSDNKQKFLVTLNGYNNNILKEKNSDDEEYYDPLVNTYIHINQI